jgi:F0F1-type ATP synthase assembly protein I
MSDRHSTNTPSNKPPTAPAKEVSAASFAGLGIQFAIGIVLFLYLGKWIDSRLGTSPAGLIGGVFIGAAASFYLVVKKVSALQKQDDALHNRRSL